MSRVYYNYSFLITQNQDMCYDIIGSDRIKITFQLDWNLVLVWSKFQYPIDCQLGLDQEKTPLLCTLLNNMLLITLYLH